MRDMARKRYGTCGAKIGVPLLRRLGLLAVGILIFAGLASAGDGGNLRLPAGSAEFEAYLEKAESVAEFYLKPQYLDAARNFTEQEASVPRQGDSFGNGAVGTDVRCYEAGQFRSGEFTYKILIYNNYGESDTVCLNIELAGYDDRGTLLDALRLENRFAYEDIERYNLFRIEEGTVDIDYYIVYLYEDGELSEEARIENPVPERFGTEHYRIGNGRFTLVSRTDSLNVLGR